VREHAKTVGATNLNQFENDANFEIHYEVTANEIIEQLESINRKPDFVIAGIGTSGHIAAISKRLRERYGDEVKVIGVQPSHNAVIPGIKRIVTNLKWLPIVKLDKIIEVSWEEAVKGVIEIAVNEGLLVGLSSGAVFQAYKKLRESKGTFILVFPDDGFKYIEHFERYLRAYSSRLNTQEQDDQITLFLQVASNLIIRRLFSFNYRADLTHYFLYFVRRLLSVYDICEFLYAFHDVFITPYFLNGNFSSF